MGLGDPTIPSSAYITNFDPGFFLFIFFTHKFFPMMDRVGAIGLPWANEIECRRPVSQGLGRFSASSSPLLLQFLSFLSAISLLYSSISSVSNHGAGYGFFECQVWKVSVHLFGTPTRFSSSMIGSTFTRSKNPFKSYSLTYGCASTSS
jgi:hypothetical protein